MRIFSTLLLLCVLIAAIGYFRGWFHAESTDTSGQGTVTVTVDKDKVKQDKSDVEQKVQDLTHK
jgi:hypothetical protein